MKKQRKAIIFDMDGVLVDNKKYHDQAWQLFASEHTTRPIDDFNEWLSAMTGRTTFAMLSDLFGYQPTSAQILEFELKKEQMYRDLYAGKVIPMAGLEAFLRHLQQLSIPCAIATSGPPENVQFVMQEANLKNYFLLHVNSVDVTQGKPHPEVYLIAAQRLGLDPQNCLIFEDSLAGIQSGIAAGADVIGVASSLSHKELLKAGVLFVIDDFTDARLDEIIGAEFRP